MKMTGLIAPHEAPHRHRESDYNFVKWLVDVFPSITSLYIALRWLFSPPSTFTPLTLILTAALTLSFHVFHYFALTPSFFFLSRRSPVETVLYNFTRSLLYGLTAVTFVSWGVLHLAEKHLPAWEKDGRGFGRVSKETVYAWKVLGYVVAWVVVWGVACSLAAVAVWRDGVEWDVLAERMRGERRERVREGLREEKERRKAD